jgi:hypothetical protein
MARAPITGPTPSASSQLDPETLLFVNQLHNVWSSNTNVATYVELRDQLLNQKDKLDSRISTLSTVAKIACPSDFNSDVQWKELHVLAKSIDEDHRSRKRKRAYLESVRLRNYAVIVALWSSELVLHYGWDKIGQGQMYTLRTCATNFPRFEILLPRLNSILLQRHREGILFGRLKTLNELPIQPRKDFDSDSLALVTPDPAREQEWLSDDTGEISLADGGPSLLQLRPHHFRAYLLTKDRFGVLVARDQDFSVQPPSSSPQGSNLETQQDSDPARSSVTSRSSRVARSTSGANLSSIRSGWNSTAAHSESSNSTSTILLSKDAQTREGGDSPEDTLASTDCDSEPAGSVLLDENLAPMNDNPVRSSFVLDSTRAENTSETVTDYYMQTFGFRSEFNNPLEFDLSHWPPAVQPPSAVAISMRPESLHVENSHASIDMEEHQAEHEDAALDAALFPRPSKAPTTIEETLHRRYSRILKRYAEQVAKNSQGPGGSLRSQWFHAGTRWASIWSTAEESSIRSCSPTECDVIYCTAGELVAAAQGGDKFRKPIVIKEQFMDSGMHTVDGLLSEMTKNASKDTSIEIKWLDDIQPMAISLREFSTRTNVKSPKEGANALNLRNFTNSHRPLFTMLPRFRLLDYLVARIQNAGLGKNVGWTPNDVASCLSFNIIGLEGAFSGAHLDSLNGTWVRNLQGIKLWMIVPEKEMEHEWDTFARMGSTWTPNGKERLVLLERDDVIFMPPGLRILHAVHSMTDCVMEGGMVWDERNVIQILQSIHWICKYQVTTNEALAYQLPSVIEELGILVREQTDRFRGALMRDEFLRIFEEAMSNLKELGCDCLFGDCSNSCACRQEARRCTGWCSRHPSMPDLYCMGDVQASDGSNSDDDDDDNDDDDDYNVDE